MKFAIIIPPAGEAKNSDVFRQFRIVNDHVVKGVTSGVDALAGEIGEVVRAYDSAIDAGTTEQFKNITSISLTAGDWDVTGIAVCAINGSTIAVFVGAISVHTGNTTTDHVVGDNQVSAVPPTLDYVSVSVIPAYRLSLTATTTVYLKGLCGYSAGTPKISGRISARRMR